MRSVARAGSREERRPPGLRLFLVALALTFANFSIWSWASPLFSSPDEPTHVARAAAVVRGELVGKTVDSDRDPETAVRVPDVFAADGALPQCYQFRPAVPASCAPPVPRSTVPVPVDTYVGRYPPLYYAIVGAPSLVVVSPNGIYGMRLASAAACAVLLALAFLAVARWSRKRALYAALLVSVTPMVWFVGGMVNPSGLEISAAVCVWTAGSVLVLEHSHAPPIGLVSVLAVSVAVLVLSRPLSPLWCAISLSVLGLAGGWRQVRALASSRAVQVAALCDAACAAFALWWILSEHSLDLSPSTAPVPQPETFTNLVPVIFGHWGAWAEQMVGVFGWLDTRAPTSTYVLWGVALTGAVVFGAARAGWRGRAALGALVAAAVLVPVAAAYSQVHRLGIVGQGKDFLPLAIGVPIVAAAVGSDRVRPSLVSLVRSRPKVAAAAWGLWCTAIALAGFAAFFEALRRYAVGTNGPLDFFHGTWSPPLGVLAVLVGAALSIAALSAWVFVRCRRAGVPRSQTCEPVA